MANIVITSTTNCIIVVFNDSAVLAGTEKGVWDKTNVNFELSVGNLSVIGKVTRDSNWEVTFDGSIGFQIDTIDGVAPTSNSDLFDKLTALKG